MGVPKDFPYIASDSDSGPMYSTPWFALGGAQPENSIEDLLPKELCEAGLCDSVLPGCRQASFKKMHFPKLVFNMSRPYLWADNNFTAHGATANMFKSAMSWAFSAMPEAITVSLKELEEKKKAEAAAQQVPNYFPGYNTGVQSSPQSSTGGNSFSGLAPQTSGQALGGSKNPLNTWFNTQRRLGDEPAEKTAYNEAGQSVKMPSELQSHQIRVEFPGGLPYVVNHQLVSLMTRHGYFQDLDDGSNKQKGELKITGFYLEDGGSISIPVQGTKALRVTGATGLAGNKGVGALVAATSGLALVSFAAIAYVRHSRHAGYEPQKTDETSGME